MLTFLYNSLYNSKASCASDSQTYGILAQLGEHLPYKQRVIGSSPIGPILQPKSCSADVAQLAEQLICNQQVIGSSPIIGLISIEIINFISRDGAVWKLVGLITRRSQVQILLPQFTQVYCV